jgi:hypothetical protein
VIQVWPVSSIFRKSDESPRSQSSLTPLGCIVHVLARRSVDDEGFMIRTECMSTDEIEYRTRERVEPGETLLLKIVSGPHIVDVKGVVQTVARNNLDPSGPAPRILFTEMSEKDRRLLQTLIERHKTCIA